MIRASDIIAEEICTVTAAMEETMDKEEELLETLDAI